MQIPTLGDSELIMLLGFSVFSSRFESQTPVGDFDVFAFSISFEWDYVNVLTLLRLAGIPARAAERSTRHPLIVIGGAVTFVNPEPLAPFADVIAAGEGEALIPTSIARSRRRPIALTCCGCWPASAGSSSELYEPQYRRRRHADRLLDNRGNKRGFRPESGTENHRGGRSACDQHLHPGHGVRIAVSRRGGSRLRESLPFLLGGLQLSSRPRFSDRAHSRARIGAGPTLEGLVSIALCDHPDIEGILSG